MVTLEMYVLYQAFYLSREIGISINRGNVY